MATSFNSYTVQVPMANGTWHHGATYIGNCPEHVACALFAIDPATGEFEQYEIRRNY